MDNTSQIPASTVLVATADELLLDDLLRLAAAAEVTPRVERDLLGLRRCWQSAALVVVGQDLAGQLATAQPVRRPGVVIAGADADDADLYRRGVVIGVEGVFMLPDQETDLSDKFADALDGGVRSAVTLAFVGGCGGAGATTLAAAVAVTRWAEASSWRWAARTGRVRAGPGCSTQQGGSVRRHCGRRCR